MHKRLFTIISEQDNRGFRKSSYGMLIIIITARTVLMFVSVITFMVNHQLSQIVVLYASLLRMWNATCVSSIQLYLRTAIRLSKQFNRFHRRFAKTNAEFDVTVLFILRIHYSQENSKLMQQLNTL